MKQLEKEVWDEMEGMGWSNPPTKGLHLEYYQNIIKCTKKVLNKNKIMERELGYYWINDGDGGHSIAEYVGNSEWVFAGCSVKFETEQKWIVGDRIKPKPQTSV